MLVYFSGAFLTCCKANESFKWANETKLALSDSFTIKSSHSISRHVARLHPELNLYPTNILERTEVCFHILLLNFYINKDYIVILVISDVAFEAIFIFINRFLNLF